MANDNSCPNRPLENNTNDLKRDRNMLIEPLFNSAFIRIFGKEESKGITRSLINAVLERAEIEPIGEIRSIEAEHTEAAGSVECRSARMDVRVVAAGRRMVDLEAQLYPDDVDNRSVFYASQLMVNNTHKNTRFSDIPQAVVITLLDDSPMFPNREGFLSVSRMMWETKNGSGVDSVQGSTSMNGTVNGKGVSSPLSEGSDRFLFVLVELAKVRERYNELSGEVLDDLLLSWLYLLTAGFDDAEEAEEIMCMYPDLKEFAEMYGRAVDDPEVLRAYENEAAAYRNYHSRKDYLERIEREATERGEAKGYKDGEAKGIERGIEQGIEQAAERLRAAGVAEETVRIALGIE